MFLQNNVEVSFKENFFRYFLMQENPILLLRFSELTSTFHTHSGCLTVCGCCFLLLIFSVYYGSENVNENSIPILYSR